MDQRQEIVLLSNYHKDPEWTEVIRLVARMLPNADEYIKYLLNTIKLSSVADVALFQNVWDSEPICSEEVSKNVARKILDAISHSAKFYKSATFSIVGCTLIINVQKNTSMQINKIQRGNKNKVMHPLYILPVSLPALLNILYKIGYNFEDILGNSNNTIIKLLKENDYPNINEVKIQRASPTKKSKFHQKRNTKRSQKKSNKRDYS